MSAYNRAYYEANKEEKRAYRKTYRKANKEKIRAYRKTHKEEARTYAKDYGKANAEKRCAITAKRRASKIQAVLPTTDNELIKNTSKMISTK